jgi:pimeloyl-ACP methyl ester carboxylesterase
MGYLGLILLVFLILAVFTGMMYQRAGSIGDARRFPAPGVLVDIVGGRLHVYASGEGFPLVVFEAGVGATSLSWSLVQPQVSKFTSTMSYDRAWLGWSDPILEPRDTWTLVEELRQLLVDTQPVILVAHSYGALIAAAYASRYPQAVAGMVLVDPIAASDWKEPTPVLRRGILLARRGALLARLGVVRFALNRLTASSTTVAKLIAKTSSGNGTGFIERWVGQIQKLPPELWPTIRAHWCEPKCFEGIARYLEALPKSAAEDNGGLADLPLTVLSHETASPSERSGHAALAARSTRGEVELVEGSGHWIQLDRPDVVIRAIDEMVRKCRV